VISRHLGTASLLLACACGKEESPAGRVGAASASNKPSSIAPPTAPPTPRQGMAYIAPGALVVGTPPSAYPRLADEEVAGEQLIVGGFYIDVFPYPNEEGAIPLTNVTNEEAAKLCAERSKRLCSELEWERACKGPDNRIYEYGDGYRPEPCGTGTSPALRPTGLRVGCRSDFGVRDLHGGVWEWTRSPFGRGTARGLISVRGGNAPAGELAGRCANTIGRPPDLRSPTIGFRCCVGADLVPEVELPIRHARKLEARDRLDPKLVPKLMQILPDDAKEELAKHGTPEAERMWSWWPVGNDELVAMSVCAGSGRRASCGVIFARVLLGQPSPLAWAHGGTWSPMLDAENDPRDLWLLGGDDPGAFRRRVSYVWGKLTVGARERRIASVKDRLQQERHGKPSASAPPSPAKGARPAVPANTSGRK
jgi:sulfatase modifying factor 1